MNKNWSTKDAGIGFQSRIMADECSELREGCEYLGRLEYFATMPEEVKQEFHDWLDGLAPRSVTELESEIDRMFERWKKIG